VFQALEEISVDEALKASRFLKHQFFVTTDELKSLIASLGTVEVYMTSKVYHIGDEQLGLDAFFAAYETYLNRLEETECPPVSDLRVNLSPSISASQSAFGVQKLGQERFVIKSKLPHLQFQICQFVLGIDDKVHFTFGKEARCFGLQALYPQLFIETGSINIKNGLLEKDSPNALLYKAFASWIRHHTHPVSFIKGALDIKSTLRMSASLYEKLKMIPHFAKLNIQL